MVARIGDPLTVTEIVTDAQRTPAIAQVSDNAFVVGWQDEGSDGPDRNTADAGARVIADDGTPQTGELALNTNLQSNQINVDLVGTQNCFTAVREDFNNLGPEGSFENIAVRPFSLDGTSRANSETLVDTDVTAERQSAPAVANLGNSNLVAAWDSGASTRADSDPFGVRARLLDADGAPQGPSFSVPTSTRDNQLNPDIAALADGGFVAVWGDGSNRAPDTDMSATRARMYDADGTPRGDDSVLNTTTDGFQNTPQVAGLDGGGFVTVWRSFEDPFGDQDTDRDVVARVHNADGSARTGEIALATTTAADQAQPDVAALEGGGFVAVWSDKTETGGDTSESAIRGRVFDGDGDPAGDPFLVNQAMTLGQQDEPRVAALGDGRFAVTWASNNGQGADSQREGIRTQVFEAEGVSDGPDAVADSARIEASQAVTIDVLANDDDAGASRFGIVDLGQPDHGTLEPKPDVLPAVVGPKAYDVVYSPDPGFSGTDSFTYTVGDGDGNTDTATVTVTVAPAGPENLDLFARSPADQVAAVYLGYFGRAPDPDGADHWTGAYADQAAGRSGADVVARMASSFSKSPEAANKYAFLPPGAAEGDDAPANFVDSVYANLFNRQPTAEGLAYWTDEIEQRADTGAPIGDVIVDIMAGAGGDDARALANKIEVARAYTDQADPYDADASISLIGSVGPDEASVDTALAQIG